MTSFNETPSEWLDDELRRVPLPGGMMDRLRALAALSDDMLDAQLREVPLPTGLISRLKQGAQPVGAVMDDAALDRALRDVPVPANLHLRLSAVAIERAKPLEEERLRDIPVPQGFVERLERTALRACLTDPETELDGARENYVTRASALATKLRPYATRRKTLAAIAVTLSACILLALGFALRDTTVLPPPGTGTIVDSSLKLPGSDKSERPPWGPNVILDSALDEAVAQNVRGPNNQMLKEPIDPHIDEHFGGGELPGDLAESLSNTLGALPVPTSQPIQVAGPVAKGATPTWKNPELLMFLLAHGVHPSVPLSPTMQPASDASILTCRIPTTISTESFESAWSLLDRKQLNNSERQAALRRLLKETRTEEFLAALDYGFTPPAPGMLDLRTAGGVSPFGQSQQRLMQVAVVAGDSLAQPGKPQPKKSAIADEVRLSVTFNPRTVASYRLLGHEATSVLGVHHATLDATLRAGDVCTGLFEVELRSGGDDLVATAEVTWRDPHHPGTRRETRRITRWQLADSLLETPPSVQAAAIAAETAELLRQSQFAAGRGHSWARIRQVAADAHPTLAEEPTFRRLMGLVDRAEQWGIR
ncbi:MAG: DUF3520 domain-containing protein [Planctomycetes bacterium]|nr:DUF3520 domain-containing protein [Planctomycetota bacterium]